jgi:hypothetical protein
MGWNGKPSATKIALSNGNRTKSCGACLFPAIIELCCCQSAAISLPDAGLSTWLNCLAPCNLPAQSSIDFAVQRNDRI